MAAHVRVRIAANQFFFIFFLMDIKQSLTVLVSGLRYFLPLTG